MICVHVVAVKNTRIAAVAINKTTALKYILELINVLLEDLKITIADMGKKLEQMGTSL